MAPHAIRIIGDPVLKQKAADVTRVDGALAKLIDDMFVTMYDAPGVGLAAPQVGVQQRFFVYDYDDEPGVIINPTIVESRGEFAFVEGCLSVPGLSWEIVRPDEIHVTGFDLDGNEVSLELDEYAGAGLPARDRPPRRRAAGRAPHRRAAPGGPQGHPGAAHARPRPAARARGRGRRAASPLSASVPEPTGGGRVRARTARGRALAARPASPSSAPPTWPCRRCGRCTRPASRSPWWCPGPTSAGAGGAGSTPSPVKAAAAELGLPVTDDLDAVLDAGVDLGVVVAYGRIIPRRVLEAVPMVNLHFSLLPRWRGAAPVERALLAGDETTGVCLMEVAEGLDTGAVYAVESHARSAPDDTLDSLRGRLVEIGSRMLVDALTAGLPTPVPQAGEPTYAAKIDPAELEIDWTRPAVELDRLVRLGGAWTTFRGKRLKVWQVELEAATASAPATGPGTLDGTVVGHRCRRAAPGRGPARGQGPPGRRRLAQRHPPGAGRAARP